MTRDIEPTPEDFEAARESLKRDAREYMLDILAKQEARRRIDRERRERRRRLVRRLLPFRRPVA